MKSNMGSLDKIARVMLSILLVFLFATDAIQGTLGWIVVAVAVVFTLTSIVGFCPLYTIFGISTKKK
jgi:hypothetical protein